MAHESSVEIMRRYASEEAERNGTAKVWTSFSDIYIYMKQTKMRKIIKYLFISFKAYTLKVEKE